MGLLSERRSIRGLQLAKRPSKLCLDLFSRADLFGRIIRWKKREKMVRILFAELCTAHQKFPPACPGELATVAWLAAKEGKDRCGHGCLGSSTNRFSWVPSVLQALSVEWLYCQPNRASSFRLLVFLMVRVLRREEGFGLRVLMG